MSKNHQENQFRFYTVTQPNLRAFLIILSILSLLLGLFFIFFDLYAISTVSEESRPMFYVFIPAFLFMAWPLPIYDLFLCYYGHFQYKNDRFEIRLPQRDGKMSFRKEDVASYGQGESGTIAFFDPNEKLLGYVPLPDEMPKENFLLEMRYLLEPFALAETAPEEAEKRLCEEGVL